MSLLSAGTKLQGCLWIFSAAGKATLDKASQHESQLVRRTSGRSLRPSKAYLAAALTRDVSWGVIRRTAMSRASGTSSIPVLNSKGAALPSVPLVLYKTCREGCADLPPDPVSSLVKRTAMGTAASAYSMSPWQVLTVQHCHWTHLSYTGPAKSAMLLVLSVQGRGPTDKT